MSEEKDYIQVVEEAVKLMQKALVDLKAAKLKTDPEPEEIVIDTLIDTSEGVANACEERLTAIWLSVTAQRGVIL